MCVFFFFFKQKTAYEMRISDWSSDVCSSDLRHEGELGFQLIAARRHQQVGEIHRRRTHAHANLARPGDGNRPVRERDPGMNGKQFAHLNSPHREKTLSYNIPLRFVLLIQQTKRRESMTRNHPLASHPNRDIETIHYNSK